MSIKQEVFLSSGEGGIIQNNYNHSNNYNIYEHNIINEPNISVVVGRTGGGMTTVVQNIVDKIVTINNGDIEVIILTSNPKIYPNVDQCYSLSDIDLAHNYIISNPQNKKILVIDDFFKGVLRDKHTELIINHACLNLHIVLFVQCFVNFTPLIKNNLTYLFINNSVASSDIKSMYDRYLAPKINYRTFEKIMTRLETNRELSLVIVNNGLSDKLRIFESNFTLNPIYKYRCPNLQKQNKEPIDKQSRKKNIIREINDIKSKINDLSNYMDNLISELDDLFD
ncbi:hypothetical protein [Acanthamoeba castellanii mimivirus]|jgi:hypothetical protein|uniref:Uncharacterized protein L649 n=5 Tax=Mimivirus TaxID=315393 RepID=YL649_MIMIV|nr:hypothetical protein MIMI_gp0698 [Acanthamoeba polyphaga mimivirus]Q5UR08.1 RecName: Full=Uncharacterized protein L649 [Acanthamoeba polyphaga mimivirus]AHA45192.1 hypothetical protein HIRU_S286 [Hirudovirus strain Sangsue]AHJ40272.1 hypothetical protein [Samba virus]ALR84237.1 hypothetical protein [Niemeyer virus]AMZ03092.1 hypothetical protein [Mimivirus Bombay]QTF49578.1 hypothetical protein [Mimivirus reunion]WMV62021.1 hypothetical protein qu_687 [Mimivirus sp.]BAV61769.1 hypothetic